MKNMRRLALPASEAFCPSCADSQVAKAAFRVVAFAIIALLLQVRPITSSRFGVAFNTRWCWLEEVDEHRPQNKPCQELLCVQKPECRNSRLWLFMPCRVNAGQRYGTNSALRAGHLWALCLHNAGRLQRTRLRCLSYKLQEGCPLLAYFCLSRFAKVMWRHAARQAAALAKRGSRTPVRPLGVELARQIMIAIRYAIKLTIDSVMPCYFKDTI